MMDKWQQIAGSLKGAFGTITVIADGHEVAFYKRVDGERLVIETYVDGWIKGKWTSVDEHGRPEHPEGRFYRPRNRRAWPLKEYSRLKRVFGKKKADEMIALRTIIVSPIWNSPKTLISHLKKHFPDLEIKADEVAS
ncbi:hypothetical protein [Halomonas salina]|uniref:HNH endonuclease n=1 Tax=Halomonas salina TaxID=42565 RepID=A0ABR4WSI1_9GAMM|nr:hypothetical protein [Halomonas salina]KGE77666.1 hypothetical protein FP66_08555 [Halomonas salina]